MKKIIIEETEDNKIVFTNEGFTEIHLLGILRYFEKIIFLEMNRKKDEKSNQEEKKQE